jgi:dienelactone hydrolase
MRIDRAAGRPEGRPLRLPTLRTVVLLLALAGSATPAFAAGRAVTIHAENGRAITATLFEANHLPAPAVVLVPALGHPRDEWTALAQRFADQDITALTIDLPAAVFPPDVAELSGWTTAVRGAIAWLAAQSNVRSVGIAGASLGGSLAAAATAAESRVHALAIVSPSADYRGFRIESAMRQVGARPVLLVASRRDPYALRSARELAKEPAGSRETMFGEAASHGVPLLAAEPDLGRMLIDWFQRVLGVH